MSNFLAENLAYLRREKKLSQQELAEKMGINRTTMSAYELKRAEPSIEMMMKFASFFEIGLEQMLSQKLDRTILNAQPAATAGDNLKVLAITVDKEDNENIELVQEKAAAGYLSGYSDPEFVQNLPRLGLPFLKGGTFRAFEIKGDSMLPIISGSIIIGQYIEKISEIKLNEPYVLVTLNNGILFKRVADLNDERIILKSDNRSYSSYSLPLDELQEVWKAKWYISNDFTRGQDLLERVESSLNILRDEVQLLKGKDKKEIN